MIELDVKRLGVNALFVFHDWRALKALNFFGAVTAEKENAYEKRMQHYTVEYSI